jgi:hypothetical protein
LDERRSEIERQIDEKFENFAKLVSLWQEKHKTRLTEQIMHAQSQLNEQKAALTDEVESPIMTVFNRNIDFDDESILCNSISAEVGMNDCVDFLSSVLITCLDFTV